VREYPKGLRIFTQYVLLPLVVIYLIILYFYEAKILFTLVWPRGIVSYLIIGFSTLGILALLLVWPLRDDAEHTWIRTFTKRFFLAIFPLIVLLIMAIGRRVMEYGVTENRYFLIVLSLWLFIVALYFLFSRRKNIKFVPLSLFFAALLCGFGPWNAFEVSSLSQHSRLENFFQKNKMIVNGKATKSKKTITKADQKEIASIVEYMIDVHGVESIQDLFTQDLAVVTKEKRGEYFNKTDRVLALIGLDSGIEIAAIDDTEDDYDFSCTRTEGMTIAGYDYMLPLSIYPQTSSYIDNGLIESIPYTVKYLENDFAFTISVDKSENDTVQLRNTFMNIKVKYEASSINVDKDYMRINASSENYDYLILLDGISVKYDKEEDKMYLSSLRGKYPCKKEISSVKFLLIHQ